MKKLNEIICFEGDTLIQTINGMKKIKDIVPGNVIFSYNTELNVKETSIVKRVANSRHNKICKIYFEDKSVLEMTLDHPIWIIGKGWSSIVKNKHYQLEINSLEINDKCLSLYNNNMITKTIIDIEIIKGDFTMYNISGGIYNNFFANTILVHDENLLLLNLEKENIQYEEV
jgi:hypothetical protein